MSIARLQAISTQDLMPQVSIFVDKVKKMQGVHRIILFGSMARQEMTEASDIDLAVILDSKQLLREQKAKILTAKREIFHWPCDLLIIDKDWYNAYKDFGGICVSIQAEGRVLFDQLTERQEA